MIKITNPHGQVQFIDAPTPEEAVKQAYLACGWATELPIVEAGEHLINCHGFRARPVGYPVPIDAMAPRRLDGGQLTEWCYFFGYEDGVPTVAGIERTGVFHPAIYNPTTDRWEATGPGYMMKGGHRFPITQEVLQ